MIKKMMKRWAFARFALRACSAPRLAAFNEAMDYKAALLKTLGLASTATDEEIAAALAKVETETETEVETMTAMNAAKADLATAQSEIATLKAQLATAGDSAKATRMLAINSALNAAVNAGLIAPASRPAEQASLENAADLSKAIEELEKRQPAFNTQPLNLTRPGASAAVPEKMADRIAAYNAAVADIAKSAGVSDEEAERQVKANPRFKALVESLSQNK